jgi:hypothetical protein
MWNIGNTACKVPLAATYINKIAQKDKIGVKKKTAICLKKRWLRISKYH